MWRGNCALNDSRKVFVNSTRDDASDDNCMLRSFLENMLEVSLSFKFASGSRVRSRVFWLLKIVVARHLRTRSLSLILWQNLLKNRFSLQHPELSSLKYKEI